MTSNSFTHPEREPQDATAAEVRASFNYDSETGAITWRSRPLSDFKTEYGHSRFHEMYVGKAAGKQHRTGRVICFKGLRYPAEQIAWLHAHGSWPEADLEFEDGNTCNYAIENLYEGELPFTAGLGGAAFVQRRGAQTAQRTTKKAKAPRVKRGDLKSENRENVQLRTLVMNTDEPPVKTFSRKRDPIGWEQERQRLLGELRKKMELERAARDLL